MCSIAVERHGNVLNVFSNSLVSIQVLPEPEIFLQVNSSVEQVENNYRKGRHQDLFR